MGNQQATPIVNRSWYASTIHDFLDTPDDLILGKLANSSLFSILPAQKDAWVATFPILRNALRFYDGKVYLEFEVPRMGHRIDVVAFISGIVFTIEFKVAAKEYSRCDIDQAYDYAADLKYFHEGSHRLSVIPILVATEAKTLPFTLKQNSCVSGLYETVCTNENTFSEYLGKILHTLPAMVDNAMHWERSRYCPTPTIIEAARALYAGHNVVDISRSDASATNLHETSERLIEIINLSKDLRQKSICFVTGVPGAGKTLVGLNIATKHMGEDLQRVFLSGNGPLIAILREALARDTVQREYAKGNKIKKGEARTRVKAFIQNVHHFRDEYLKDRGAPIEHVALFDEAQRAWNKEQTAAFMRRKRGRSDIVVSEPEFLISCMDRRNDWAVIICLVGGGQEINTGEAGIRAWIDAVINSFQHWNLYISPSLLDSEYGAGKILEEITNCPNIKCTYIDELHLGVSMRSFRSENVSEFVKKILDCEIERAKDILRKINGLYPIYLTRNLATAKEWLRIRANGSERYGIVVSSQAERLKPHAIDVKTPVDPVKWFLEEKEDVRSSFYLEDVATEFHVQGLELDWVCVAWDGDFRYKENGWQHYSFRGTKWQHINKVERQIYLKNAYRVLLTRARQGMVIYVPEGSATDPTRHPHYYDSTYEYLHSIGLETL